MTLAYPDPELSDGVIRLRPWDEGDLECIREASEDLRIVEATTVPAKFSVAAGRAFIARQRARAEDGEGLSLAVADAGGGIARGLLWLGLRSEQGVLGIGFWLVPGARGRGMALRAVRLAADWSLRGRGVARVEAWVEPDNDASQRLLASAGFSREGVLPSLLELKGRRADAVVYSRLRCERVHG